MMARARPGNPTLRDSLGSTDPGEKCPRAISAITHTTGKPGARPARAAQLLSALTQSFRFPLPANIGLDNSRLWDKGTALPLGVTQISFHEMWM